MTFRILLASLSGALFLLPFAQPTQAAPASLPGADRAVGELISSRPIEQVQRRGLTPTFNSAAQPRFNPPPPMIRPPAIRPPITQPSMPRLGPSPRPRMQFGAPAPSYFGSAIDARRRSRSPSLMPSPMQQSSLRRPAAAFKAAARLPPPPRGLSGFRASFRAAAARPPGSLVRGFNAAARRTPYRSAFNRAARLPPPAARAFNAAAGPAKSGVSRSALRPDQRNIYDEFRKYLGRTSPSGFTIMATSRRSLVVRNDAVSPSGVRGAAGRLARAKLQFGTRAKLAENVLLARIANDSLRIHAERAAAHIRAIRGDKIVLGRGGHFETVAKAGGVKPYQPDQAQYEALKKVGREFEPNKRFLDDAIRRGARIFLASPPATAGHASDFRREIDHLRSRGYRLSENGLEMVKGK